MSENAFIQASRRQLRFATSRGLITTEDLWQLSLKSLDGIGQNVIASLKPGTTSLLENPDPKVSTEQQDNELRLEIIKIVIDVKQDENKAANAAAANKAQREFIQGLLEKKKIGAMESMSEEDLKAQLAALG